MLILQLKNNLTKTEVPRPFNKKRSKHKISFDLLVSYHHFQLMFLSPIRIKWVCIHIGNSSGRLAQTGSRFPKLLRIFDTG